MNKNEILTVTIEDMSDTGEGIGKYEGYTLFVKDALPGDKVRARITKAKKQYAFARCEEILEPSPDRVTPPCPVSRACGGCQLQALSYPRQLAFKEAKVRNCLERIGGLVNVPLRPIIGMETPLGYRNKAQFPVGRDKNGRIIAGFYAGRTHSIIANDRCLLGSDQNEAILAAVKSYMEEASVSHYDEKTQQGLVRHVLIREGHFTGQIMVCLVVNGQTLPEPETLIKRLREIPGMHSILLNSNTENTNVILGARTRCLWGSETIGDRIGDLEFQISAKSFFQVNSLQTSRLYAQALAYAGLTGKETVWDLYCGIGTISLFLARKAKQVYGVEIVEEAVVDARCNAAANGITNAVFFAGKAEEVVPRKLAEEHLQADVIVVDPPRKGCDEKLLAAIVQIAPPRVVYISCDPATLARDLKYLCANGYRLAEATPVDMFPMGVHVETVCLLSKLNVKQHIEVELTMDEMDLTAAENKASYEEIKAYVLEKFGMKVSHLYIAQVKRKYGIIERENYNKPKSENAKQPQCPPEKEAAIRAALEYFKMI